MLVDFTMHQDLIGGFGAIHAGTERYAIRILTSSATQLPKNILFELQGTLCAQDVCAQQALSSCLPHVHVGRIHGDFLSLISSRATLTDGRLLCCYGLQPLQPGFRSSPRVCKNSFWATTPTDWASKQEPCIAALLPGQQQGWISSSCARRAARSSLCHYINFPSRDALECVYRH